MAFQLQNILLVILLIVSMTSYDTVTAVYIEQEFDVISIDNLENWRFYALTCTDHISVFTCGNLAETDHGFSLDQGTLIAPNSGINTVDRA